MGVEKCIGARDLAECCKTMNILSINLLNNAFAFTTYLCPGSLKRKDKYVW